MKYTEQIKNDVLILYLEGNLIGDTQGSTLTDVVADKIKEGIIFCAIDLSGIGYMSSAGISILINILTKIRNKSGDVVLINPSDPIKKLLIITKLNTVFDIVANEDEAFRRLKK